jgi:uncharacterized membrane protein
MSDSDRTFSADFKRFFVRGLVVLLPSVLTLWIVVKAYQFVDNTIAEPVNRGVRIAMINTARFWTPLQHAFDPTTEVIDLEVNAVVEAGGTVPNREVVRARLRNEAIHTWWRQRWYMDLIGLVVAIIAVYVCGRLLGGFVGRRLYRRLEGVITTVPVFKQVYPYVKQIVDFLFSDEKPIKFNRVVVVEYPRKGIWSVGFLTGNTLRSISDRSGSAVTVFIPSSPTPFTGYTITVPREDVVEIPISVEEAIRFSVSGGVLVPAHQTTDGPLDESGMTEAARRAGLLPIPGEAADPPPTDVDPSESPEQRDAV